MQNEWFMLPNAQPRSSSSWLMPCDTSLKPTHSDRTVTVQTSVNSVETTKPASSLKKRMQRFFTVCVSREKRVSGFSLVCRDLPRLAGCRRFFSDRALCRRSCLKEKQGKCQN